MEDLEIIEKDTVKRNLMDLETIIEKRVKKNTGATVIQNTRASYETGLILHLDGDASKVTQKYFHKLEL